MNTDILFYKVHLILLLIACIKFCHIFETVFVKFNE